MYDRIEKEGMKFVKYQTQTAVIEIERGEC